MEFRELMYKGVFYTMLFSGLFEYYSLAQERFVKANNEEAIHAAIDEDLLNESLWEGLA